MENDTALVNMDSYKNLILAVRARPRLTLLLKIADLATVLVTVIAYATALIAKWMDSPESAIRLSLVCGIPFVIVSLVRRLINAPRPYELYDVFDTPPKKKEGYSFPSRHAFSVFAIGTALAFIYPIAATVILVLGALLSLSRVLLGKHFPRDVIAGALVGTVTSVIGMLILF